MAGEEGKAKNSRRKPRLPLYFFIRLPDENNQMQPHLHRRLHIDRANDIVRTWCYPLKKRVAYTYSDTLRNFERGFTTMEVCDMINRRRTQVEMGIVRGNIPEPPFAYNLDSGHKTKYVWHEENILEAHDYFSTVHRGRPRKDGIVIPQAMPTRREIKGIIRQNEILYVKQGDEFVPTWRAADF